MNDNQGSAQNLEDELTRIEGIAKSEGVDPQVPQQQIPQTPPEVPLPDPKPEFSNPAEIQNPSQSSVPEPANPIKPEFTQELLPEEKIPLASQPLTNNKKSSKVVMIIVVIFFVLSLAGLGFYYIGSQKPKVQETPPPVATFAPAPTATLDPTANWKTYLNTQYSFKYPNDIIPKEGQGNAVVLSKLGPTQKEGTELFDGFSISFNPAEVKGTTLESYVNALIDEIKKQDVSKVTSGPNKISINNYNGLTYTEEGLGTFKQIVLVTTDKDLFMQISIFVADPGKLGFQTTADQILSTFKFIESTATPSASPTASPSASASATPTATP